MRGERRPVRLAEFLDCSPNLLRERLHPCDGRRPRVDPDRLSHEGEDARETDTTMQGSQRPFGAYEADGKKRRRSGKGEAGGTSMPRPLLATKHGPLREHADRIPGGESAHTRGDCIPIASPARDRDPAERAEDRRQRADEEVVSGEEANRTAERRTQEDRVEKRLVVRRDHDRAKRHPLDALHLEAPDNRSETAERELGDPVGDQA
jgi:hypothetical protein